MLVAKALTFLLGRSGKTVLLIAALVGWTAYQRHDAYSRCQERSYIAQLEERDRQLAEAERVAQEARQRADEAQREMEGLEAERDAILAEHAGNPDCSISDDLRRRLLSIR
jgi:flagellar biosynthesis regulator FlaF